MNSAEIKEMARSFGADLVGIAPVERFDGMPKAADPRTFAPGTRSVIVVGHRITRGSMRGVEEGTSFSNTYSLFGHRWMRDMFLAKTVYDLCCEIERNGFEAVPLAGKDFQDGKFAPDYQAYAHAAGLGSTGKGGFFLTPEYGHRQRFGIIFTTLELDGDDVIECDFCKECNACIEACPLQAYKDGIRDPELCRNCRNGAFTDPGCADRVDRYAASCGRACMVALEDKVSNRFAAKFRKRSIWQRSLVGTPVAPEKQFTGGVCPNKSESK